MSKPGAYQLLRSIFAKNPALTKKLRSTREWGRLKNLGLSYADIDAINAPKNYNVSGFLKGFKSTPK
jgi:hypothetical protein